MEKSVEFLNNNSGIIMGIVVSLIVAALFWGFSVLLYHKIIPAFISKLNPDKFMGTKMLIEGFSKPISAYLKLVGLCIALLIFFRWNTGTNLSEYRIALVPVVYNAIRIISIIMVAWGLIASNGVSSLVLRRARRHLDLKVSKSVSHFLAAVYNVVVVSLAAAILIKELGHDINGLVAGLGLGGLTIALAAKDSAANFFGGLVMVTERPFEIGDWIVSDGVEGIVEDISLRSTKVRTAPGALTIVPNANLSSSAITNWSGGMEKRKAEIILFIKHGTQRQKLKEYCASVRNMIEIDPEVISDTVLVRFTTISEFSLNILVSFYTTMPGYADHLRIKERINYSILELADKHGITFAYPTRTLYMNEDKSANTTPEESSESNA